MEKQVALQESGGFSEAYVQEWPDVTQIVNTVLDAFMGKQDKVQAAKKLAALCKDTVLPKMENKARMKLNDLLGESERGSIRELSEKDFADRLITSSKGIASMVLAYYRKEISLQNLVDGLSDTGIYDVAKDAIGAMGIPEIFRAEDMDALLQMSADVVGYTSMTAIYQELRKALEDDRIAHERRIRIEQECAKSVASIAKYRSEMDRVVNSCLKERYETFEKGFAAMDQAILDQDTDGYIQGNVEIQKVLGYDVQFASQDEFDDLMMSEEAFKF